MFVDADERDDGIQNARGVHQDGAAVLFSQPEIFSRRGVAGERFADGASAPAGGSRKARRAATVRRARRAASRVSLSSRVFRFAQCACVHVVEGVQINGHDFRRMLGEQGFDGGFQLRVVHCRRQIVHHAVLVLDFERVQEIHEHRLVFVDEPGADEAAGGGFQRRARERGDDFGVLLGPRLAFQKDRAHVPRLRDGGQRGLVDRLVRLVGEGENFIRQALAT